MRLDIYVHFPESPHDTRVEQKLNLILNKLLQFNTEIHEMAGELDALTAQVAENTSVEQSAITLLNDLHQRLADAIASGDPARVIALRDQLAASKDGLAAAVAANTA